MVTAVISVGVIEDTRPPGEGALATVDGFGTFVLMLILARVRLVGAGTLEDGRSGTDSGARAMESPGWDWG